MRQSVSATARVAGAALVFAVAGVSAVQAADFTVLHQFDGRHGATPVGALAIDPSGNLYGTTAEGGRFGYGTLFQLRAGGFRTLHNFRGGADGATPTGGLLVDATRGKLYGTTSAGGPADAGTVFEMGPGGAYRLVTALDGAAQGSDVQAGLALDGAGYLYGAAMNGGDPGAPLGTLFRVDPASGTLAVLHSFTGDDGAQPMATPLLDGAGLHGTGWGGSVYSMGIDGSGFMRVGADQNADGLFVAGQTADGQGDYWGVAMAGVASDSGDLYRIDASGNFTWRFNFDDEDFQVGRNPTGTLVLGDDGRLYGTTRLGGPGDCRCGTVFSYDPASGQFATIHAFTYADGAEPWAGLVKAASGHLYGVTQRGGRHDAGTLFRITP